VLAAQRAIVKTRLVVAFILYSSNLHPASPKTARFTKFYFEKYYFRMKSLSHEYAELAE
jgi:hypothetical protein